MTENAQIPAARTPGKADTSDDSYDYETAWKGLNQILFITKYMLNANVYEPPIQRQLQTIHDCCTLVFDDKPENPAWGKLSASNAAKLITPLAEQMAASPVRTYPTIFEAGNGVLECCKNIESLSGA